MSETMLRDPRQPARRTPGVRLDIPLDADETPEKIAWTAAFLQVLGVTSKRDTQGALQMDMLAVCKTMEEQTLPADPLDNPYCAANLTVEASLPLPAGLKPGPEFMAYLKALKDYEGAQIPRPSKVVATLREKAQGYLDHYDAHPKGTQSQPQNLRKKMLCENTIAELRKYELRDQVQALGNPPWDSPKSMQAASLKAEADFMSTGNAPAEVLGGDHVNPAFWINRAAEDGKPAKSFIFKPKTPTYAPGVPSGGETAREAATGRMSDLLKGSTGIDFGLPETHIVALPRDRFPADALDQVPPGDSLVGSLQEFAKTDGDLRSQSLAERCKVPAVACQKTAVLDLVTLNLDRHSGNLLITKGANGTPSLTPIDHGRSFPDPADASTNGLIASQIGDRFNATLALPGAHEPFSKEMLEAIDRIDPIALKAAMKAEVGDLGKAFPGAGDTISEASIDLSRRSAMFLKLAAPQLSPAAVQVAFGQNAAELLDPKLGDDAFAKRAEEIIARASMEQGALAEYLCLSAGEQSMMEKTLKENGWPVNDRKWMLTNPSRTLALYRGNVRNPVMMQELGKTFAPDVLDKLLKSHTLERIYQYRDNPSQVPDLGGVTDETRRQQLEAVRVAFPNYKIVDEMDALVDWKKFNDAGGMTALDAADGKLNASPEAKKSSRNNLGSAVSQIARANSLTTLDETQREAKLNALEKTLPSERPNRNDLWQVSEAIRQWDAIAGFSFAGKSGFEAIELAGAMLREKVPTSFGGAVALMANAKKLLLVGGKEAQQELRELDEVWPDDDRNLAQQARDLENWRAFKALGGSARLEKAVKDMALRHADIDSLATALETLRLYAASSTAVQGIVQQDPAVRVNQAATAPIALLRQSAKLFLPPNHALFGKMNEVEQHAKLITKEVTPEFKRLLQALRVTVVDTIRGAVTTKVTELRQRRGVVAKSMPEDDRMALDNLLERLEQSVSGGQFDADIAGQIAEVTRQIVRAGG